MFAMKIISLLAMKFGSLCKSKLFSLFVSALFLACSLEILKHHDEYVTPLLDNLATIVIGNLGTTQADCTGSDCVTIAEITDDRFRKVYHESSPIDRCQLKKDLQLVIDSLDPKVLFVDYDLSPTVIELACQSELDQFLDEATKFRGVALIKPFNWEDGSSRLDPEVDNWVKAREAHGVKFASAELKESAGLVSRYEINADSVAVQLCELMACGVKNDTHEEEHADHIINSSKYASQVQLIRIEDLLATKALTNRGLVLVGGRYGEGDTHSSALSSKTYGVDLHAAAYVSHRQPVNEVGKLIVLLIDVLIGVLIGWFSKKGWDGAKNLPFSSGPLFPPVVLLTMFVFTVVTAYLGLLIAACLFGQFNVWINPVMIIMGMVLHAFVMEPAEIIGEEGNESGDKATPPVQQVKENLPDSSNESKNNHEKTEHGFFYTGLITLMILLVACVIGYGLYLYME